MTRIQSARALICLRSTRRFQSSLPKFPQASCFSLSQSPNPNWDLGEGIAENDADILTKSWKDDLRQGWKSFDPDEMSGKDTYSLLTSAVIPRPIAFVSTISSTGTRNLAPMSYFNLVSHNPPLLSVSLILNKRRPKDTRENILATKEFTVNIISEPFVEAANACAIEAPEHVDEWIVSGLTPEPSTRVKPPLVQESAVGLECELYESLDIRPPNSTDITNTLVLGLIKQIHIRNSVFAADGKLVDPAKLRPVARLSGGLYAGLGNSFDLDRPSWRALKERIESMHRS